MGMDYDLYWNGDCNLVKAYREAFKIKRDLKNQDFWLQGMYMYEVMCDVSPAFRSMGAKKPNPYRSEPFDLTQGQEKKKIVENQNKSKPLSKEEKSDKKARQWMEILAVEWNSKFEKGEVGEKHG